MDNYGGQYGQPSGYDAAQDDSYYEEEEFVMPINPDFYEEEGSQYSGTDDSFYSSTGEQTLYDEVSEAPTFETVANPAMPMMTIIAEEEPEPEEESEAEEQPEQEILFDPYAMYYDYTGYDASSPYPSEFGVDTNMLLMQPEQVIEQRPVTQEEVLQYLQANARKRKRAHPLLVFALMLFCFPVGIVTMLFFTDWGFFAKLYITLFALAIALSVYEILVLKQVISLPSIIEYGRSLLERLMS